MIYIYILINPINNEVFYVGATEYPYDRLNQHLSDSRNTVSKKGLRIKEIIQAGYKVEIEIVDCCRYYFACFWEQFYMDLFRSYGFTLLQGRKSNYPVVSFMMRMDDLRSASEEHKRFHWDMVMDLEKRYSNSEFICFCEE